jgi:RNA-directed DNA polymerase
MLYAVKKHTDSRWMLLYIERWLKAAAQLEDGSLIKREKGTPQGKFHQIVIAAPLKSNKCGDGDIPFNIDKQP